MNIEDILIQKKIFIFKCDTKFVSLHNHKFLELVYVIKGSGTHWINDKEEKISKGNYFFIDYKTKHSYRAESKDFSVINCLFLPEFIDENFKGTDSFLKLLTTYLIKFNSDVLFVSPANHIFSDKSGKIYNLLSKMIQNQEENKIGDFEIIRCMLIELIIFTLQSISFSDNKKDSDSIPIYIKKYVNENFRLNCSLSEIAQDLYYSVPYLSKFFKEKTGYSFREYLKTVRINESCRLLISTNLKIIEIAESSGYTDLDSFNKAFKSITSLTPSEYRKLN